MNIILALVAGLATATVAAQDGHATGPTSAPGSAGAETASPEGSASRPGTAVIGPIRISGGFARAMLPGQTVGGGYLAIANAGTEPDRLVSVASPVGTGSIHAMVMKGDVMIMRPIEDGIEIPAGATVLLKPGSTHLMFTAVSTPFEAGAGVPVTLVFERAGSVALTLPVAAVGARDQGMTHDGHAMP